MHCFVVMARLMHRAFVNGIIFRKKYVALGLISALMHDTGYIQLMEDSTGTGGKYTLIHLDRSIEFIRKYLADNGYSFNDLQFCCNCLKCTDINAKITEIHFESWENELLGKILGTADLIGQMSDRPYLEKLLFLYEELRESGISDFQDELDLLKKTPNFWEFCKGRFATDLGQADQFLRSHFRTRWGIDRDLLREVIERNMKYLKFIMEYHEADYRRYLSYEGIKEIIIMGPGVKQ